MVRKKPQRRQSSEEVSSPAATEQEDDSSLEILSVDTNLIDVDPENPQVQNVETFNLLAESIKQDGFLEPILAVRQGDRYLVVGGAHRLRAAQVNGIKKLPLVVVNWDEGKRRTQMVKMNVIRGRLDPEKFTKLWTNMKAAYGEERLKKMMGLDVKEVELRRLLKTVKRNLPEQMQQDLERRADKIHSVEDLAAAVQALYSRYGSTLESHFILFSFGGKIQMMIKASEQTFEPVSVLANLCSERKLELDVVLAKLTACRCGDCMTVLRASEERGEG